MDLLPRSMSLSDDHTLGEREHMLITISIIFPTINTSDITQSVDFILFGL